MNKKIIKFKEYKGLVQEICRLISQDGWKPDYVVGITRGGLLPATMISHYFDIPMHTLKVSLRDHGDCESNLWMSEDAYGYDSSVTQEGSKSSILLRRNILIVDDINDSGATINWIKNDWQSSCLPKDNAWESVWGINVRFAALVENTATKSLIKTSYVGKEINKKEHDVWIEFPYENWWA